MTSNAKITVEPGSALAIALANLPMNYEVISDLRHALDIPHEKRNSIENNVAVLYAALDQGLISARRAARHTGLTIDDLADLCTSYGHTKPFDL